MSVGHDEVLPHRLLPRDRRLRARGDVGRHRLPPLPHAGLDRGERRRRASCASCTCGRWARASRGIWTGRVRSGFGQYFMGTAPLVPGRQRRLPAVQASRSLYGSAAMLWGYFRAPRAARARYDDPAFRALPAPLPARVPAPRASARRRGARTRPRRPSGARPRVAPRGLEETLGPTRSARAARLPFDRVTMRDGGRALPRVVPRARARRTP